LNCHPERSEAPASAVAFAVVVALLAVIPQGLLLALRRHPGAAGEGPPHWLLSLSLPFLLSSPKGSASQHLLLR
jgi:hypothetical protein